MLTVHPILIVLLLNITAVDSILTRQDLFTRPRIFERAANATKTSFTPEEKELILQIHNSYRSLILPSSKQMRELVWDDDLEAYSSNHTQACTGRHSHRRMVKTWPRAPAETWINMGENLYWNYGDRYSIEEALWLFWEEGKDYDIATHNCTHVQTCGHFRVVVTEHNWRVGCSINQCPSFTDNPYPGPAMLMSCTYNGVHLEAAKPYEVGEVCAGCNIGLGYSFQECRNRLCVSQRMKNLNLGFQGDTSVVGLQYEDFVPTTSPSPTTQSTTLSDTTAPQEPQTTTDEPSRPDTSIGTTTAPQNDSSTVNPPSITQNYTVDEYAYIDIIGLNRGKGPYAPKANKSDSLSSCLILYVISVLSVSIILAQ